MQVRQKRSKENSSQSHPMVQIARVPKAGTEKTSMHNESKLMSKNEIERARDKKSFLFN
jgi:hypothetical protein